MTLKNMVTYWLHWILTVYPYKHQILLIWQEFQHNDPKEHSHILITLDTDCIPLQTPNLAYLTSVSAYDPKEHGHILITLDTDCIPLQIPNSAYLTRISAYDPKEQVTYWLHWILTVYLYKHQILLIWQEFQHNDPKEHGHILITLDTDCIPLQTPNLAYLTSVSAYDPKEQVTYWLHWILTVYPYKYQILLIWQEFQHNDPKEHGHILITLDTDCIPLQTPDSAYLTRIST